MIYIILLAVLVVLLLAVIRVAGGDDRYKEMSEEEFEAEARRVSMTGVAMTELQKHIDPQHKVEYLSQRDKHAEADSSESGDRPPDPPAKP
jgi:hypothetical protein